MPAAVMPPHDFNLRSFTAETVLVLLPAYSAPSGTESFTDGSRFANATARSMRWLRGSARSQHVRSYRDYYANPRSPQYMIDLAREMVSGGSCNRIVLITDLALTIGYETASWTHEMLHHPGDLRSARIDGLLNCNADAVVLLYPDPLGIGLGRLEKALRAHFPDRTFVLNGRRRCYRLDGAAARSLAWRRFLAETRMVETMLSYLVWPVGLALAASDAIFRRKHSRTDR